MFAGNGHCPRQNARDGADRDLVVLVGLQSDSDEDVAELRCQRSYAKNFKFQHDTAVARQQLALGKHGVDRGTDRTGPANQFK